jgi:hypothetical protein
LVQKTVVFDATDANSVASGTMRSSLTASLY